MEKREYQNSKLMVGVMFAFILMTMITVVSISMFLSEKNKLIMQTNNLINVIKKYNSVNHGNKTDVSSSELISGLTLDDEGENNNLSSSSQNDLIEKEMEETRKRIEKKDQDINEKNKIENTKDINSSVEDINNK